MTNSRSGKLKIQKIEVTPGKTTFRHILRELKRSTAAGLNGTKLVCHGKQITDNQLDEVITKDDASTTYHFVITPRPQQQIKEDPFKEECIKEEPIKEKVIKEEPQVEVGTALSATTTTTTITSCPNLSETTGVFKKPYSIRGKRKSPESTDSNTSSNNDSNSNSLPNAKKIKTS